ncbi:hypothetical protein WR25_00506 [Diploscapter pachys]|uniref:PPIase FKBP-type domain-containing protein n=1 Tax=Diploscapter pachys TaxID=2018661 RepID=A0A2A2KXY9_9BILA|nr:hypothetical protein WR25_00506 [Diploscapter pachys]
MDVESQDVRPDEEGFDIIDKDDFPELCTSPGRQAVSSGEPSLDGSIDVDEERGALSDSEITHAARTQTIAAQVKGPSSDALEESCRQEASARNKNQEWDDILGSGDLLKKTLRAGKGTEKPQDGQWVTIRVIDTLRGIDSHNHVKLITGFSMVVDAWELVVKLMVEGECVAVKSKARFAYGELGLDELIHPNEDQEYTIELLEILPGPNFESMSDEELADFVLTLKERGNFYFSRAEYEKAIFVYKRASGILDVSEKSESVRKLFSALHSNLAVCYAKLEDWKMVLESTEQSLNLHDGNAKALYRRATALNALGDIPEATECLTRALELEPNDTAILNELRRMSDEKRRLRSREKQMYKRMLSGVRSSSPQRAQWWQSPRTIVLISAFVVMLGLTIHFILQL